jgi:hypothetical protein
VIGSGALLTGLGQMRSVESLRGAPGETLTRPEAGGGTAAEDAGRSDLPSAPTTVAPTGPGFAPEESERRIARTASLTLAAPEQRIDDLADGVVAATARHRGFVVSSSTFSGEEATAGGSLDLRVPSGELRATLSELASLGAVRAQSQTGDDVTEAVATTSNRLAGARAQRRALLRRLERAETYRQAQALRRQLELVPARSTRFEASSAPSRSAPTTRRCR